MLLVISITGLSGSGWVIYRIASYNCYTAVCDVKHVLILIVRIAQSTLLLAKVLAFLSNIFATVLKTNTNIYILKSQ